MTQSCSKGLDLLNPQIAKPPLSFGKKEDCASWQNLLKLPLLHSQLDARWQHNVATAMSGLDFWLQVAHPQGHGTLQLRSQIHTMIVPILDETLLLNFWVRPGSKIASCAYWRAHFVLAPRRGPVGSCLQFCTWTVACFRFPMLALFYLLKYFSHRRDKAWRKHVPTRNKHISTSS